MRNSDDNLINSSKLFGVGDYAPQVQVIDPAYNPDHVMYSKYLLFGGICFALYWLSGFLLGFRHFPFPYNFIGGYYHFAFNLPIRSVGSVYEWLSFWHPTSYSNLNKFITWAGSIAYSIFLLGIYSQLINKISDMINRLDQLGNEATNYDYNDCSPSTVLAGMIFLPMIVVVFWFLGSLFIGWLFA